MRAVLHGEIHISSKMLEIHVSGCRISGYQDWLHLSRVRIRCRECDMGLIRCHAAGVICRGPGICAGGKSCGEAGVIVTVNKYIRTGKCLERSGIAVPYVNLVSNFPVKIGLDIIAVS